MNAVLRRRIAVALVCVLMLTSTKKAKADTLSTDVTEVIVGIVLVTAAITVGIVLAIRHKPSITGCTVTGPDGLTLKNEGDGNTYILMGDLAKLTTGQRVRVNGKKKKSDAGVREFMVEKVTKSFGACPVTATP